MIVVFEGFRVVRDCENFGWIIIDFGLLKNELLWVMRYYVVLLLLRDWWCCNCWAWCYLVWDLLLLDLCLVAVVGGFGGCLLVLLIFVSDFVFWVWLGSALWCSVVCLVTQVFFGFPGFDLASEGVVLRVSCGAGLGLLLWVLGFGFGLLP